MRVWSVGCVVRPGQVYGGRDIVVIALLITPLCCNLLHSLPYASFLVWKALMGKRVLMIWLKC